MKESEINMKSLKVQPRPASGLALIGAGALFRRKRLDGEFRSTAPGGLVC